MEILSVMWEAVKQIAVAVLLLALRCNRPAVACQRNGRLSA
jgi:hypothetical protein